MRILILGASGKVGRLTVDEALSRGHHVRAFVHRHSNLPTDTRLDIVQGSVVNDDDVIRALAGYEAVICTLGSWGTASKDIVSTGIRHCIPAMEQAGIERIITLTGAEARDAPDKPAAWRNITHALASAAAGKILFDGEEHIRLLRASTLDWTALRSPVMTNNPRIFYKLSLTPPMPWETVSRRAIAKALLDQLDGPAYSKTAPFIRSY